MQTILSNGNIQSVVYGAAPKTAVATCTASDGSKAYSGTASYESSDSTVVRVDIGGTLTVNKAGTATITAT